MQGMTPIKTTVLFKLKSIRQVAFIFGCRVIALLTLGASQRNNI
jgi:hypothetical protein